MGHPKVVPCFHSKASCQMVLVLGALDVSQCPDIPTDKEILLKRGTGSDVGRFPPLFRRFRPQKE